MSETKKGLKLSKAQQRVVDRMREGWALAHSSTYGARSWLQRNGVGNGGPCESVNGNTFLALVNSGIIRCKKYDSTTSEYMLAIIPTPEQQP